LGHAPEALTAEHYFSLFATLRQAALALAKRGENIDRCFIGVSPGGVGRILRRNGTSRNPMRAEIVYWLIYQDVSLA
jgi:hypothetical protein